MRPQFTQEDHEGFRRRLRKSDYAVGVFARYLLEKCGVTVDIPPSKVAPTPEVRHLYSDNGDLFIVNDDSTLDRVEVKGTEYDWTGYADWPHKPHYIINRADLVEKFRGRMMAYVALNDARTHCGIVWPHLTQHLWYTKKYYPRTTPGRAETINMCLPVKVVEFRSLSDRAEFRRP